MKLAFSTLGCPEWNIEQIVEAAKKYGFDGIELRGIQEGIEPHNLFCLNEENREKTLALLAQNDLGFCVYGTSAFFHDPSSTEIQYQKALDALRFCSACGIPMMRVFGNEVKQETEKEQLLLIANCLQRLCSEAEKYQVKVLLEVHGNLTTVERLCFVAERINSKNFGLIWDVGHTHIHYGTEFEVFYRAIKKWIVHIHLKDALHSDGKQYLCRVGEGSLPLRDIVSMLEKDGYQGFYSLEWEKRWHPELEEPETVLPHFVEWMNGRDSL